MKSGNEARGIGSKFALLLLLCRHIGLLSGKRLDTILLGLWVNNRIHPSTRYLIRWGFIFFSLWRVDLKISGFGSSSPDGSHIQKEKVPD